VDNWGALDGEGEGLEKDKERIDNIK